MNVFLNGLATAIPSNELPQDLVLKNARRIFGSRYTQFERMAKTFQTSGVETRYSLAPFEWFDDPKSWPDRNKLYLEGGTALFVDAAKSALKSANLNADQIDAVVTVSSTGVATPTLEALAWKELGFRSDIRRIPVFGLGCAGGVSGMSIAQAQATARPGTNILLVAIEACTLSFRSDRLLKADIIAAVLFGDGAAAACLSTTKTNGDLPEIQLQEGQEEMWPDTLSIMGWDVDETGLGVIFDRSIPAFAEEHFAEAAQKAAGRAGIDLQKIDRLVSHPGGAKVVDALEKTMKLEPGTLDVERTILRDYGNMSAPTVLFVLKRVIEQKSTGSMMMCALGPGFTASFLPISIT